jgi:hypothetical protein
MSTETEGYHRGAVVRWPDVLVETRKPMVRRLTMLV